MAGDANFASVSLLLHFDGANGSTAFSDSSAVPHTITASGAAALSTAQSKFGGASLAVSGVSFAAVGSSSRLDVATGDFTVEMSICPTAIGSSGMLINKAEGTGAGYPFQAFMSASGGLVFRAYDASGQELFTITSAGGLFSVGDWAHVALVRSGSGFAAYVNGAVVGSATYAGALPSNSSAVSIGAYSNGVAPFSGYIDELRITKGIARYTANFSPPTEAFGGPIEIALSGVVRDAADAPAARLVRAVREDTGAAVGSVTSNAVTGAYLIATTYAGAHTLNAYPAAGENLPALILRGVVPV